MVAVVGVMAALVGAPAIARVVADYANNADKVDRKHAVGSKATLENAARKLVAMNGAGQLPAKFIPKVGSATEADHALSADNLVGFDPADAVKGGGTIHEDTLQIQGSAQSSTSQDFMNIPGFGRMLGICAGDLQVMYLTDQPAGALLWVDDGGTNPTGANTQQGPGGIGAQHGPVTLATPYDRHVWEFRTPRATLEMMSVFTSSTPNVCTIVATLYMH